MEEARDGGAGAVRAGEGWSGGVLGRSSARAVTCGVQRCLCNLRNHGERYHFEQTRRRGVEYLTH